MDIYDQEGNPVTGKSKNAIEVKKYNMISSPLDFVVALRQMGIIHKAKTADLVNYLNANVAINEEKYEMVKNVSIGHLMAVSANKLEAIELKKTESYFQNMTRAFVIFMNRQVEIESLDLSKALKEELLANIVRQFGLYKEKVNRLYNG